MRETYEVFTQAMAQWSGRGHVRPILFWQDLLGKDLPNPVAGKLRDSLGPPR